MINITNYDELFKFFDAVIDTRGGSAAFLHTDESLHFSEVFDAYARNKDSFSSKVGYSQMIAAFSFCCASIVSVPKSEKTKVRRYELSFYDTFPTLFHYVGNLGYYVYNLYTKDKGIIVKRDLFASCLNLVIHYRSKIFILHNWVCDTPRSLLLTVLSPCPMFTQNEFDFED